MIDLMAHVDWSDFESPALGTKLRLDRFVSTDAGLAPLARGGRLFVVTLTPKPEQVLLVAVLEHPTYDGAQWTAPASDVPLTDITQLRSKLRFGNGEGWKDYCEGCQQTHIYGAKVKLLAADDVAMLEAAVGLAAASPAPANAMPIGTGRRRGALLDAILEHPASDEARRIYADQLLADNDIRGEFISIDIALAGQLSIRKRVELSARRAHLLAGYAAIWWPYKVKRRDTQRGFLRGVHGTWEQIEACSAELFAHEPVTQLGISNLGDAALASLLAAPWLPRIERLIVRGLSGDRAFATLASSPQLAKLRALDVTANGLGAGAFTDIQLPQVENLVLTGNPIDDAGLEALRAWPGLANVHTLYLSGCEIGERGLERLVAAPLDKLAMLTLSNNRFGDAGAASLATGAARLPALEHLELKDCALSTAGAQALLDALPKLRRLDVRRNRQVYSELSDARIRV